MREIIDKINIVKFFMNYCFLEYILEQWGYEKEIFVLEFYFKKLSFKYQEFVVVELGFVIN